MGEGISISLTPAAINVVVASGSFPRLRGPLQCIHAHRAIRTSVCIRRLGRGPLRWFCFASCFVRDTRSLTAPSLPSPVNGGGNLIAFSAGSASLRDIFFSILIRSLTAASLPLREILADLDDTPALLNDPAAVNVVAASFAITRSLAAPSLPSPVNEGGNLQLPHSAGYQRSCRLRFLPPFTGEG